MKLNLTQHLSDLSHGQVSDLIRDPQVIELVQEIIKSRRDYESERGKIILDVLGGSQALLDSKIKRNALFLTLSKDQRKWLRDALGGKELDSLRLTTESRKILCDFFEVNDWAVHDPAKPHDFAVELIQPVYPLFPHQREALFQCLKHLGSEHPRVMLHMPTGSGKTRTAMHLVAKHLNNKPKGVILWLVAGRELCDQAANEFEIAWGAIGERPIPLIRLWSSVKGVKEESFDHADKSESAISLKIRLKNELWPAELEDAFVVASVDSMRNALQSWQPRDKFKRISSINLVVFDEAHRAVATTYKDIVDDVLSRGAGLLGLSATPGRRHYAANNQEADLALVDLFGANRKVTLNINGYTSPVEGLISAGYLAKLRKEKLEIAQSVHTSEIRKIRRELEQTFSISTDLLKVFGMSATRNLQIIDRVEKLVHDEGHKRVIVFAPSTDASNLLANLTRIRGIDSASIIDSTAKIDRERFIANFKSNATQPIVLFNYSILSTGFDAPKTSAVVIARPTGSIVLLNQMAGRALRGPRVGGNETATLVTVIDTDIPELVETVNQFHAFDDAWKQEDL